MTRRMIGAVVLVLANAGCYSTWDIAPKSLDALNGFHAPEARPLQDMRGDQVMFDSETQLHFEDNSGAPKEAKFASIEVQGTMLSGLTRPNNYPFSIDLKAVNEAYVRRFSWGKTALLVGVIVAIVVVTPIVLGIVFGTQNGN